jgi:uncharacterized repeat protein (TIGR01451 family)
LSRDSDGNGGAGCDTDLASTGLETGAKVVGSSSLQANYIVGDENSTYELRGFSAFPRGLWTKEYYAPVGDYDPSNPTSNTDVFLYNPHGTALEISYATENGNGTFSVPAQSTVSFQERTGSYMPVGSGAYFSANDVFWGVSTIDTEGQIYDWGYSLVPSSVLRNEHRLGWAPAYNTYTSGCTDPNPPLSDKSGIFVTPVQGNTRLFVDTNGDGNVDQTYDMNLLDSIFVADPDGDLSNLRLWATGPYAAAWGQNPSNSGSGDCYAYDMGYTVLPGVDLGDVVIEVDKSSDPPMLDLASGASTQFTLQVTSGADYGVNGVSLQDSLPAGFSYVDDSTTITFADGRSIVGNAADPAISGQTLTWSLNNYLTSGGDLAEDSLVTVVFTAINNNNRSDGDIVFNETQVCGTRTVQTVTQTFCATDFETLLFTDYDLGIVKDTGAGDPVSPGDTIPYTVTVTNSGSAPLTGVSVYDPLPRGVSYVPGSATVVSGVCAGGSFSGQVRDQFDTNDSYAGNNGNDDWDDVWTENDTGGAVGGDIQVNGNRLEFNTGTDGGEYVQRSWTIGDSPATVTVSFDFADQDLDANDDFFVEYSIDGGGFNTLQALDGNSANQTYTSNIAWSSSFSTITVRIRAEDDVENNEFAYFDNVDISYAYTVADRTPNISVPPNLLQASEQCTLSASSSLELSFDVTVIDPLPNGLTEIVNTASANATEIPLPVSDDARNIVGNPSAQSASVGDRVWHDSDGDGVLDVGEAGMPGVQVTLKDQFGTPLQVTSTDSLGRYQFTGVTPGTGYYVEVTGGLPGGLTQTNGTNNRTSAFNLIAGQIYEDADLGYRPASGTAIIGDRVWSDPDGDGVQDAGEPGLAGVTVLLYTDTNGNGVIDVGEPSIQTVTAPNGSYLFNVTATGTQDYIVYVDPTQSALTAYGLTTQDTFFFENVADGGSYRTADVGVVQQSAGTTYAIKDRVWLDSNRDAQDDGETGIAGVTVDLLDASGNVIATTATAADGTFNFTGVPAGMRYRWRVTDQNAVLTNYYGTTSPAQAGVFQMPGVLTGALDYTAEPTEPNFGYNLTRSIGDTVFNDLNGNGTQDPGEPGISGVVVKLYNDTDGDGVIDGGVDIERATLTSDANGKYLFSGLTDGNYIVSIESPPAGYSYCVGAGAPSAVCSGAGQPADSDGGTSGIQRSATLAGGVSDLDNDFGFTADSPQAISGRVWNDANNDGDDESGAEAGFENVTVELYQDPNGNGVIDPGEPRIGATSTDANGDYRFSGVQGNGTEDYIVRVTDENGVLSGTTTTYEGPNTDGTGDDGSDDGEQTVVNLTENETRNFGYYLAPVPLPITLASLDSQVSPDGLSVEWTTATETRNAGFHLYGRLRGDKVWQRLTEELVPSKVIDSLEPQRYGASFRGVAVDQLLLEDWDTQGQTDRHGPFAVNRLHGFDAVANGKRIDWRAIRAENRTSKARRTKGPRNRGFATPQALAFAHGISAATAPTSGDALLWVTEPGVQRVSFDALQAAGADFGGVAIDDLALTDRGKARPRHVIDANENGAFDSGDGVEFVGMVTPTLYSARNAYRLQVDPSRALVMAANSRALDAADAVPAIFPDTVTVEQERVYSYTAPTSDPWYDQRLFANGKLVSLTRTFDLPSYAGGDATLHLSLWGVTDWPGGTQDHHLVVRVNGILVEDAWFDGSTDATRTVVVPAATLNQTGNTLTLEVPGDTGYDYDIQAFDGFSVAYERGTEAHEGRWQGTIPEGMTAKIAVTGFEGESVAWRGRQRRVGDAVLAFRGKGDWVAADGRAIQQPKIQTEIPVPAATPVKGAADYLIVTHPQFLGTQAMADLVALQQGRGFSTAVVDVDSLYAAYSDFEVDPEAIRRYLRQARSAYVLLVGGDSYDYQDHLGLASQSFVPTHYLPTGTLVTYTPADSRHVDYSGNDIPQARLGRLPVRTEAELTQMVAKLASHVAPTAAVFAAGPSDGGRTFAQVSEGYAAQLPADMPYAEAYVDDLGLTNAQARLEGELNLAGALVSYVGHSSYQIWGLNPTHGILFWANDARALINDTPHLVTQWGCWNTYFVNPRQDTMANGFLFQGHGATAVLGATALTDLNLLRGLGEAFFDQVGRRPTLGDALLRAQRSYAKSHPAAAQDLRGFALLGDPAAELNE